MASEGRRDRPCLGEQLRREAHRFEFFQAVRLLERIALQQSAENDRQPRHPVGYDYAPKQEAVRFRTLVSHAFPSAAVSEIRAPAGHASEETADARSEMVVAMMGLTGPLGGLPTHYTTLLLERIREKDFALHDFLDLFNHRTISLFYRAWTKYRLPLAFERSRLSEGKYEDLFTQCLYCLVGLGTGKLRRRLEFDDEAFLFYGGA